MKKLVAVLLMALLCINNVYAGKESTNYTIQINAASRTLQLYNNQGLIKEYPIAVGKPATKSPVGSFVIRNKAVNPYWNNKGNIVAPGPANPLGIRWLGINAPRGTYGIHGNNVSGSIGTFASGGCIRMYNSDVEELYSKIRVATPVQIKYESIELKQDRYSSSTALVVYPDVYKEKNAEAVLKKLAAKDNKITEEQISKALKLTAGNIMNPVALCQGTAVMLNNQYLTDDAFIENNEVYIYYLAALELLGIKGETMTAFSIPVIEKDSKVYINLTQAAAKMGGKIKLNASNGNAYLNLSMVKVNGMYLCSYKGSFDKEYLLESDEVNQVGGYISADSEQAVNLKELCQAQGWKLNADSLYKTIDIEVPLRVKTGSLYLKTEAFNGRQYINCETAVNIQGIENQKLNRYSFDKKSYYDICEIMEAYQYQRNAFFTVIELFKSLNSGV